MTVIAPLTQTNLPTTITVDVRAYDLGVPHLHSESVVYVYTQAVTSRNVEFIVPKTFKESQDPQIKSIEALLALITGAPTTINNIEQLDEQLINDPTSQTQSVHK